MNKNNPNHPRIELESLNDVMNRLATPQSTWHDVVIQRVDLLPVDKELGKVKIGGCQFLGCEIGSEVAKAVAASLADPNPNRRCMVFPIIPSLPFDPYRSSLYRPDELIGDFTSDPKKAYEASVDWQSFLTFADPADNMAYTNDSVDTVLARRLHDTSISDALDELLEPIWEKKAGAKKGIIAVMGGHDMKRQEKVPGSPPGKALGEEDWEAMTDDSTYTRVAFLSWKLTQADYLMVSGGGPGAMEATNLGAYFATRPLNDLRAAINALEAFREFKSGKSVEWLIPAMAVRQRYPLKPGDEIKCQSVGVPTWLYGHEPPNPFATHIAKYFENSVREEGLLAIATHGIIYAEGNAGTVQEIFQDACQNYYGTYGTAAPMILFGQDYWDPATMPIYVNDKRKKVFPLVRKLAEEKGFTHRLIVSDSLREIVKILTGFKP